MTTELKSLEIDKSDDPRFAVCYARGSTFRREGHFHRVEVGSRTVVHRALCLVQFFGNRCKQCPNSDFTVQLEVTDVREPQ